ncbi:2-nitropropane dioxygenase-like enzyme [Thermaerobacter subterraneus DSM 13965]|uniref:Probable nitronate monooxygenase n=1 Tax=Thermaerobacter subterraneus DSM 13965 TaxID=867903 RepID=K6Q2I1_9FIRM|nr:2-nitropropane dioxygenase-like enzyme [Thermaerobacter subterraneus DSM 13965]
MRTRFTERFGVELPIVQGGLAYLARSELCAAVSAAGGLGQLTAATMESPEVLRQEIRRVRERTDRPFGVNFAIGHRDLSEFVRVTIEEQVPVISVTGGNPEPLFKAFEGHPVLKMVLVAGVRQAQKAEALGADAVIAVGVEGGGHIGRDDIGTLVLVRRVVESVQIPVLASGGIVDGRGLAAALVLGADGIEMGTRFVATVECPAHPAYKQALVEARETDTVVIERSLGRPGRVLRGPWPERILEAEARGAGLDELLPLISGKANTRAALEGKLDEGFVWAGQGVGLIRDIPTVAELLRRMVDEAAAALREAGERLQAPAGGVASRLARQEPGAGSPGA